MIEELVHLSNKGIKSDCIICMSGEPNESQRCAPVVNAGANTLSCCSSVQTCCGSSNVFADIQRHFNEPGEPDWPIFGEVERTIVGCLDDLLQRDDSQPACSRKGWVKELLQKNVEVVHSGTVRIGSPMMCSGNPTHAEHTILVGA